MGAVRGHWGGVAFKLGLTGALMLCALVLRARKPPTETDFTLTGLDGARVRFSECEGRPVFLYVWQTDSPLALDNLGMLESLYSKYKDGPVCFLAVTTDADFEGTVRPFARQRSIPYPVFDGGEALASRFWPSHVPTLNLIDREGRLHHSFFPSPDDLEKIESLVRTDTLERSPEQAWGDEPDLPPEGRRP